MAVRDPWLASQYLSALTSDLEITVESAGNPSILSVFPAHVLVLKSQSSVLCSMLDLINRTPGETPRLKINGTFFPRTVEYFLRFIYLRSLPKLVHFQYLCELLQMADEFVITDLYSECERRLQKSLSVSTVCQLYEIATKINSELTSSACRSYITANCQTILNNDLHFNMVCEERLMQVLSKTPKSLSKDHEWNKSTKDGELQRKALLRWIKWVCCLKGSYVTDALNQSLEIEPVDKEVFPYGGISDSNNWIPQMFLDNKLCDVELRVEGGAKFPAHSLVLNKQSETFLSMWKEVRGNTDLNKHDVIRLDLTDLNARVAEYMLRFFYTHELPVEISDVHLMKLLSAAHRFEISSLEESCIQLMLKKISVVNCCQVLELADRLDSRLLFDFCLKKILENPDKIFQNQLHFELSKQTLVKVLTDLKTTRVPEDWGRWRCCLLGVTPDDEALSEMNQALLNEAAGNSRGKKSDEGRGKRNSGPKMLLFSRKSLADEKEVELKSVEPK